MSKSAHLDVPNSTVPSLVALVGSRLPACVMARNVCHSLQDERINMENSSQICIVADDSHLRNCPTIHLAKRISHSPAKVQNSSKCHKPRDAASGTLEDMWSPIRHLSRPSNVLYNTPSMRNTNQIGANQ